MPYTSKILTRQTLVPPNQSLNLTIKKSHDILHIFKEIFFTPAYSLNSQYVHPMLVRRVAKRIESASAAETRKSSVISTHGPRVLERQLFADARPETPHASVPGESEA